MFVRHFFSFLKVVLRVFVCSRFRQGFQHRKRGVNLGRLYKKTSQVQPPLEGAGHVFSYGLAFVEAGHRESRIVYRSTGWCFHSLVSIVFLEMF